ncbi:DUF3237 domain-containing protein [Novosphingobium sp. NBM11]|nr:DUF3237 domain-containing protein [Novosphingobium sp. NBM11]
MTLSILMFYRCPPHLKERIRGVTRETQTEVRGILASKPLCTAEFEVAGGLIAIGASPFGDQRMGYVTGGRFFGPRIAGTILPGGGNWSRAGRLGEDASVGTFDARAVWRTDEDELIYLTYTGAASFPIRCAPPSPIRPRPMSIRRATTCASPWCSKPRASAWNG